MKKKYSFSKKFFYWVSSISGVPTLTVLFLQFLVQAGWAGSVTSINGTGDKTRRVLAPYAQSVPNESYTFIGVSHPSLSTALSQIGIILEVRGMKTIPNNEAGRATVFTIESGETHRIFVVNKSHSTINSSNAAFSDSNTHFIYTYDSAQFGNINALSVNQHPTEGTNVKIRRDGVLHTVKKYANLSQLSMWGVVFIPSSSTGFSLEFIGDAHDSSISYPASEFVHPISGQTTGAGRGIN